MRYLSLAEALVVAEVVTGINSAVLARSAGVDLLDSALHAPQAGFGEKDFFPGVSWTRPQSSRFGSLATTRYPMATSVWRGAA